MQNDISTLPVRVPVVAEESGLGFLLRAYSANGGTLAQARQQFGIRNWRSLTLAHVAALAYATSVSSDWLAARLMIRSTQVPEQFCYFENPFGNPADTNMGAHVCPECLRENRWCHRLWILPGAVTCPVHRRPLIDTCGRCNGLISWRRPGVDVCACGHYINDGTPAEIASQLAAHWSDWLDARLDHRDSSRSPCFSDIPRLLNHLSIHGATALVLAFGFIDDPNRSESPPKRQRRPISTTLAAIERGIERINSIDGLPHEARRWSAHVHIPALERIKRSGVTTADRECAALFLAYLSNRSHASRGGRYHRGQLELFL